MVASVNPDWFSPPAAGWRSLLRPGDWLTLCAILLLIILLIQLSWHQESAARVRVYQDGKLFGEYDLTLPRKIETHGPLGLTVVEIANGQVRIAKDPSPRQYCVKAGWLAVAGQVAICLPNRTSIELVGHQPPAYDSLAF